MEKVFRWIDSINQWVGDTLSPALIIMTLITSYEVMMRYIFSSPTTWVWMTNQYLLTICCLTGGYCLLKGTHIRVDIFTNRFSKRRLALIDLLTSPILFLFVGLTLWWSV